METAGFEREWTKEDSSSFRMAVLSLVNYRMTSRCFLNRCIDSA